MRNSDDAVSRGYRYGREKAIFLAISSSVSPWVSIAFGVLIAERIQIIDMHPATLPPEMIGAAARLSELGTHPHLATQARRITQPALTRCAPPSRLPAPSEP